jgi:recombinational DNA repair protein (RecF pathway)
MHMNHSSDIPRFRRPTRARSGRWALLGLLGLTAALTSCSRQPPSLSDVRVQQADGRFVSGEQIAQPLQACAIPEVRSGRVVRFTPRLTDADGRPLRAIYLGRRRMPAPKLEVYDATDQLIHAGEFEYG